MADPGAHVLGAVEIDEVSLGPATPEQEHERRVAIADLLKANRFKPEGAPGGPYRLTLGLVDNRLSLDIAGAGYEHRYLLSLSPFRRIVRDYLDICASYREAIHHAGAAQIEAIDMGRRGLHNDGAELLRERLAGKVEIDMPTARRLFTLVCALHRRG